MKTRTRTRVEVGDRYPFVYENYTILANGAQTAYSSGLAGFVESRKVTMIDQTGPEFRIAKQQGRHLVSPMTRTRVEKWAENTGSFRSTNLANVTGTTPKTTVQNLYNSAGLCIQPDRWDSLVQAELEARLEAGTNAWSQVAEPEVYGQVELMELKSTLKLVFSPISGVKDILLKARRDYDRKLAAFKKRADRTALYNRRYAEFLKRHENWVANGRKGRGPTEPRKPRAVKSRRRQQVFPQYVDWFSKNWLKYRYGIMPLLYSIDDVLSTLKSEASSEPHRVTAKATREASPFVAVPIVTTNAQNIRTDTGRTTGEVVARSGLYYKYSFDLSERWGLSLRTTMSSLYEAAPLSFVLDWIINVGAYIRSLEARASVKPLSQWTTVIVTTRREDRREYKPRSVSGYAITDSRKGCQYTLTEYTSRTACVDAGLTMKSWKGNLTDLKHLADGVCILFSNFYKRS